jgi:hypothetical protein
MNTIIAQKIIESLRKGIPPDGQIRHLTVGRETEIKDLVSRLDRGDRGALLIKANYGSGKTHLLKFIRETALQDGYAVSFVTLDAKSAIRFNRLDQILGSIWRNLEIPNGKRTNGPRGFLEFICSEIEAAKEGRKGSTFWKKLTNGWKWDYSDVLESQALFLGLRAWATGEKEAQEVVVDWCLQPWTYYARRKHMYKLLVEGLRKYFRDPRPEWKFYSTSEGIFNFQLQSYHQSWACMTDLHKLAQAAGLKGLILIFDEFEDVIYNIKNINHKESAFWNLFEFYFGKRFPGMTFYAVTPDFVQKCKKVIIDKGRLDYDNSQFDALPTFQMSPLSIKELEELAIRILDVHGTAYDWEPDKVMKASEMKKIVNTATSVQVQDRARHTIEEVVRALDQLLDGHD